MIYRIKTEWSGYSRGISEYEVEADSEEEALQDYTCFITNKRTIRDDREEEFVSIEKLS